MDFEQMRVRMSLPASTALSHAQPGAQSLPLGSAEGSTPHRELRLRLSTCSTQVRHQHSAICICVCISAETEQIVWFRFHLPLVNMQQYVDI